MLKRGVTFYLPFSFAPSLSFFLISFFFLFSLSLSVCLSVCLSLSLSLVFLNLSLLHTFCFYTFFSTSLSFHNISLNFLFFEEDQSVIAVLFVLLINKWKFLYLFWNEQQIIPKSLQCSNHLFFSFLLLSPNILSVGRYIQLHQTNESPHTHTHTHTHTYIYIKREYI